MQCKSNSVTAIPLVFYTRVRRPAVLVGFPLRLDDLRFRLRTSRRNRLMSREVGVLRKTAVGTSKRLSCINTECTMHIR
jgi:hypothetical protein